MNSIKNELWICELRTHIAKDENSTSYHYYEPIREHTPASPDAVREALVGLERAATEVSRYGAQAGSQWSKLTVALITARIALKAQLGE